MPKEIDNKPCCARCGATSPDVLLELRVGGVWNCVDEAACEIRAKLADAPKKNHCPFGRQEDTDTDDRYHFGAGKKRAPLPPVSSVECKHCGASEVPLQSVHGVTAEAAGFECLDRVCCLKRRIEAFAKDKDAAAVKDDFDALAQRANDQAWNSVFRALEAARKRGAIIVDAEVKREVVPDKSVPTIKHPGRRLRIAVELDDPPKLTNGKESSDETLAVPPAPCGEQALPQSVVDELTRLRKELAEERTNVMEIRAGRRQAAQIIIEKIGAPGPETVVETATRAVAPIRGLLDRIAELEQRPAERPMCFHCDSETSDVAICQDCYDGLTEELADAAEQLAAQETEATPGEPVGCGAHGGFDPACNSCIRMLGDNDRPMAKLDCHKCRAEWEVPMKDLMAGGKQTCPLCGTVWVADPPGRGNAGLEGRVAELEQKLDRVLADLRKKD